MPLHLFAGLRARDFLRRILRRSLSGGLDPEEVETYSNGVRKAVYRDLDGNELGLGAAPLDLRQST
jgi:hypothetical protein